MELKKYKLGEICDLNLSSLKSSDRMDDILYLDTSSITENAISGFQVVTRQSAPSRAQRKVKHNTIIFSTVRPNQNHFGIMRNPQNNLIVSSGFTTLDIKNPDEFDADYVYYKLTQPRTVNYLHTLAQNSVSAYPSINPDDIGNLMFEFPSLDHQRRIASVLSSLDSKISLNRRINSKLETIAKQLYDYWFVQFDFPDENGKPYKSSGGKMVWNEKLKREIPEGWEVDKVSALIEPIERGISYASADLLDDSAMPMINLACFSKNGDYRTGEIKYYSGIISGNKYVQPMDMLIACTDMTQGADIIGRPILASHEFEQYTFSTDLATLRSKSIAKMYLYYTLRTPFYHKYIQPFASGTNVKHLNIAGVENYIITVPTDSVQLKFERTIVPVKEKQSKILNEIALLTKQRDELLPLLMNGQVSPLNSD
jgi:type I restriction enzyme S subunit